MPTPDSTADKIRSGLRDGRGYDREAIIAAMSTDRRRAQIAREAREARQNEDYEPDQRAPPRLSPEGLRRELGQ